ncbi:MAG: HAMP domain-containing histidine kinase [Prevotella sp.]|nr:HAMP domain-containing histidine kinase [Prevotella sp.]
MKPLRYLLLALTALLAVTNAKADNNYKESAEFITLRDSVHHAFNDGDSLRFFHSVKALQNYLLKQGDLHTYYTQRCNEIVFLMNRQKIFEAYKLAQQLSKELREKGLDSEMYMAINMMGHINRYCGNHEAAKQCWYEVIRLMEKEGYYESMPPIYMNIVNVELSDNHEEAIELLEKAKEISLKYSPERVFDIETRKSVSYYNAGDTEQFLKGYKAYREGVEKGLSSVHGRLMEIYYQACIGNIDKAVEMARRDIGDDGSEAITLIYSNARRWKEAYESLRNLTDANDSINNVVLNNSMQGIQDELQLYERERAETRLWTITFVVIITLLTLLVAALVYIVASRRHHLRQLTAAYQHALESDKMKTAFIKNVSHEIRTPLNVISGFAQVLSNPDLDLTPEERKEYAKMMLKNTHFITTLVNQMLELSHNEASGTAKCDDHVVVNRLLRQMAQQAQSCLKPGVELRIDTLLDNDLEMQTNENMVRHILEALLDNAAKNTSDGIITIQAQANNDQLTIAVEDTGSGIPAAEAEHIFDRFVKLDNFKQGLGLGLPLTRTLARRLGGNVFLDTTHPQPGARFVVTLPLNPLK